MTDTRNKTTDTKSDVQSVEERLAFMEMSPESRAAIRSIKSLVDRELPIALDRFYDQVRRTPEPLAFFASEEHIGRAKGAQTGHWVNIANGDFNADYAAKVRTIGTVHARIGLEPRWYIGGYAIVLDHLITTAVEALFPKCGLWPRKSDMTPAQIGRALGGLAKAVLLDMDLAISVYLDEAEKAKQAAQASAIAQEQALVAERFGATIAQIADKDLTCQISGDLPEAYSALRSDFNRSVDILRQALRTVGDNAASIDTSVAEISRASSDLATRTERQAASVEKTANSLERLTAAIGDTAKRAEEVGVVAAGSRVGAERSGEVVQRAVSIMSEIEHSSSKIGKITDMMDEISFQTNLLALNAGVEAARAGEAGRGFAVVAQEVRVLAQRASDAAREIKTLIAESEKQVSEGVSLVGETGAVLRGIIADVNIVHEHIAAIVEASRAQASGLQEISAAMATMDHDTQQNAAMVEQSSAATHSLAIESEELRRLLAGFNLGGAVARGRWDASTGRPVAA
ncbi:MAG: globin-coupled sensor protein [Caulobacter sp.]